MNTLFIDAHNHLHDPRLAPHLPAILSSLPALVTRSVVNGTQESDWPTVAAIAREHSWITPSFGLHPWHVQRRSPAWKEHLIAQLDANPGAAIGEIGLDRWIEGHHLPTQIDAFRFQLQLATDRDLPATIHCIRAWGALRDILTAAPLPSRGILLHAYAGPPEMVYTFVKIGAYFSFSPSFLAGRKAAQRETFRHIPTDRLLVETDAPDLAPPPEKNPHPLASPGGAPLNHPANILTAYTGLAELRDIPLDALRERIAANYARLFA